MSGGETVFYDRVKHIDLVKISHFLKYLYGKMILGPFERCLYEGYLWRGHKSELSFII